MLKSFFKSRGRSHSDGIDDDSGAPQHVQSHVLNNEGHAWHRPAGHEASGFDSDVVQAIDGAHSSTAPSMTLPDTVADGMGDAGAQEPCADATDSTPTDTDTDDDTGTAPDTSAETDTGTETTAAPDTDANDTSCGSDDNGGTDEDSDSEADTETTETHHGDGHHGSHAHHNAASAGTDDDSNTGDCDTDETDSDTDTDTSANANCDTAHESSHQHWTAYRDQLLAEHAASGSNGHEHNAFSWSHAAEAGSCTPDDTSAALNYISSALTEWQF